MQASVRENMDGSQRPAKIVFAAAIGNALEWYDFLLYAFFAPVIAEEFFPVRDKNLSLLLAIGTFSVSFLARPVGAILFGLVGDRWGRRPALTATIALMGLATGLLAATPSYATIGLAAPLLVFASRLAEGAAVSGEFSSATALMCEQDPRTRGALGSWQFATQGLAGGMAAGAAALCHAVLTADQLRDWGWRLPLVLGLAVVPVGLYIRRSLPESPEYLQSLRNASGVRMFAGDMLRKLAAASGVVVFAASSVYVLDLYVPAIAAHEMGLPPTQSLLGVVMAGAIWFALSPAVGRQSDRFGRIPVMLLALPLFALALAPILYLLAARPTLGLLIALLALSGVLQALYTAPMGALMAELFPVRRRSLGMALAYNCVVAAFGGFSPLAMTALGQKLGYAIGPIFYLLATASISGAVLIALARGGAHSRPGWRLAGDATS